MKCLLCSSPLEGRGCKSGDENVNADSTSTLVLRVLPWPFIWMCIFIFLQGEGAQRVAQRMHLG